MNLHVSPADVAHDLPPLHRDDDPALDLRKIISERRAYGVRPSAADIAHMREHGYAAHFLRIARTPRRIGGQNFKKLRDKGRLDLTSEYVVFHHFRQLLDAETRRRVAGLLADSVSHPHARWESRSQL
jgi:hypothetical protein